MRLFNLFFTSNVEFSQNEQEFLNKGLKFSPANAINNNVIKEFTADIDAIIESLCLNPNSKIIAKNSCFLPHQK